MLVDLNDSRSDLECTPRLGLGVRVGPDLDVDLDLVSAVGYT